MTPSEPEPVTLTEAEPEKPGVRLPLAVFCALLLLVVLLVGLFGLGLVAPIELETAELARRVAFRWSLNPLLGPAAAPSLGLEAPTGALPVVSVAVGFSLLGPVPGAGRWMLALWGVAGITAVYAVLARLSSRRGALAGALILGTSPLYYLHARLLLGDIVNMAAIAWSMAGLTVAVFDTRSRRVRSIGVGVATLALLAAFFTRGLLLGVAVAPLGVGLCFAARALHGAPHDRAGKVLGSSCLLVGLLAVVPACLGIELSPEAVPLPRAALFAGAATTFQSRLRDLTHALFPWSALLPFALGRALITPEPAAGASDDADRDRALRLAALSTAGSAWALSALASPALGSAPFSAPAALAVLVGLALVDLDRGVGPSPTLGLASAALALLIAFDLTTLPETSLSALGAPGLVFPEGAFGDRPFPWMLLTAPFFSVLVLLVMEQTLTPRFRLDAYLAWPRAIHRFVGAPALLAVAVLGCGIVALDLLLSLTGRARDSDVVMTVRQLIPVSLCALSGVLIAPLGFFLFRDLVRGALFLGTHLTGRPLGRGLAATIVIALLGVVVRFSYYPEVLKQLSPKSVVDAFTARAKPGEPLGVFGTDPRIARFGTRAELSVLADARSALAFLTSGSGRRFLALQRASLSELNALFRAQRSPPHNLPVLDGSGETLLATNLLSPGERDQNPLSKLVLNQRPEPAFPLEVELEGGLTVLGWDLRPGSKKGGSTRSIEPQRPYQLSIYYRVEAPPAEEWDTFVHIDGDDRRFNGDHPTLEGRYPMALWQKGDYLADRHEIQLSSNFTPGAYRLYFGLYRGDRRLAVRRGPHSDDRIAAGTLQVP